MSATQAQANTKSTRWVELNTNINELNSKSATQAYTEIN